jgi:hypothetical protein
VEAPFPEANRKFHVLRKPELLVETLRLDDALAAHG